MKINAFSVIVPIRNEAIQLRTTAPALKRATQDLPAQIIYVLNGTTDESAAVVTKTFGAQAKLIILTPPSKTAALRAGDASACCDFRFYLDGDILLTADTLKKMLLPLSDGRADLVAPRIIVDLRRSKGLARRINRVWADQLSRRQDAFMVCTAMNLAGLRQRGVWPNVTADDDWARSQILPHRRMIVEDAVIELSAPHTLMDWLKVRARWINGKRQLKQLNIYEDSALKARPRGSVADLAAYILIRLLAEPFALLQHWSKADWPRDNSTRDPGHNS